MPIPYTPYEEPKPSESLLQRLLYALHHYYQFAPPHRIAVRLLVILRVVKVEHGTEGFCSTSREAYPPCRCRSWHSGHWATKV